MRLKELDGLRGIAVLAVLDCHFMAWYPRLGSQFGWLGVDLFFVLSGFLITSILLDLRGREGYFRTFYSRRALRIFPPYFVGLTAYLAISFALGEPGTWKLWLSYIFYYSSLFKYDPSHPMPVPSFVYFGLTVLWSLSVEELYYTVWAPLVRFTGEKVFTCVLLVMIVTAPMLRWWLHTPNNWEIFTFYCRMDGLAYGSAIALIASHRRMSPDLWQKWDRIFDWGMALSLCVAITAGAVLGGQAGNLLLASLGVSIADLCFASVVFAMVRKAGGNQWWVRMFRAKWLRSVGMVSYSLYLFHYPLYSLAGVLIARMHWSRHVSAVSQVLLATSLSLAVAYALWYGMESRILRWKDRMFPSPARRRSEVAETAVIA